MLNLVKGAGAGLLLLTAALPAGVLAEDFTVTGITRDVNGTPPAVMSVPSVDVVEGNLDEETIRQIFAEGVAGSAESLAGLDAKSITIPLLTITTKQSPYPMLIVRDISLNDVAGGVAGDMTIGAADLQLAADQEFKLGTVSAEGLDIGRLLGLYGLVELPNRTELGPVYDGLTVAGMDVKAPEVTCAIGAVNFGGLSARPLEPETMATLGRLSELEKTESKDLPPEESVPMAKMYSDLLTAFEVGASSYSGFDCNGKDEQGKPLAIKLAGVTLGDVEQGAIPQITYNGIDITSGTADTVKFGSITLKPIDFAEPIRLIKAEGAALSLEWLTANARKLIPLFDGLGMTDVAIDVPDPMHPGSRDKVSLGGFDLSLADYVNGIPADLSVSLDRLHVILPPTPDNQPMIAMGYSDLTSDATLALHWDRDAKTIVVDEFSTKVDTAGTVKISGVLGNATEGLFSDDPMVAMQVGQMLTVKSLTVDLTDEGLLPQALAIAAAEQSVEPAAFRAAMAAMAKGMVVVGLGGTPESLTVSNAITDFINGDAKHLVVTATAIDPAGLGTADFAATQSDPAALFKKVTLTATTGDEPAVESKPEATSGEKNPARSN